MLTLVRVGVHNQQSQTRGAVPWLILLKPESGRKVTAIESMDERSESINNKKGKTKTKRQ